jgi:surfactin synthase thioesterase subunit
MKLSDTQSLILSKASQHEHGLAAAPQGLPAAARNAVFRSMLKNGLLAECAAPREYLGLAWREAAGGARIALRITDAGLRAIGVDPFPTDAVSAFRDSAGSFVEAEVPEAEVDTSAGSAPRSLEELMANLLAEDKRISVQRVGAGRYIAYLPGSLSHDSGRLRLVGADPTTSLSKVVRAIEASVTEDDARVMLVGSAAGGAIATEIAATARSSRFVVEQVVTAGAPSAQVPRIPEATRVLSLEDRSDPVVLLGSLINASTTNRLTVVFDAAGAEGTQLYVTGARAADGAAHPELRAEITRMQDLGFLAG